MVRIFLTTILYFNLNFIHALKAMQKNLTRYNSGACNQTNKLVLCNEIINNFYMIWSDRTRYLSTYLSNWHFQLATHFVRVSGLVRIQRLLICTQLHCGRTCLIGMYCISCLKIKSMVSFHFSLLLCFTRNCAYVSLHKGFSTFVSQPWGVVWLLFWGRENKL